MDVPTLQGQGGLVQYLASLRVAALSQDLTQQMAQTLLGGMPGPAQSDQVVLSSEALALLAAETASRSPCSGEVLRRPVTSAR